MLILTTYSYYRSQIQGSEQSELITELLGNHSVLDPPDPIPNSEVKWYCADDSVGSPHVKVGHCQAFILKAPIVYYRGFFMRVTKSTHRTGSIWSNPVSALSGWCGQRGKKGTLLQIGVVLHRLQHVLYAQCWLALLESDHRSARQRSKMTWLQL